MAEIRRRRCGLVLAVVAAVAGAGSCRQAQPAATALPARPPTVTVTMTEYRFAFARPIPAGRVVFAARNAGRLDHRLTLVALPDDMPPLDAQLHGSERRVLTPFAGVPSRHPGQDGTFAVDLVAGRRYGLLCSLPDSTGRAHALLGMNAEFVAGARSP